MGRGTRNFYLLLFVAIFIIISISLYGSIDNSARMRRSEQDEVAEKQVSSLRSRMSELEATLRKNDEEMDRLRSQLSDSEKKRKELVDRQIEKENEIYDEKEEARKEVVEEEKKQQQKAQVAQPADWEKRGGEGGGNKAEVVHKLLRRTTKASVARADTCGLRSNLSIPHSHIQMFDMYNLLAFDNPDGGVWKQGWEIKYDAEAVKTEPLLEVVVVPHSHCDPGWIQTFEDYFKSQTKNILDGMIEHLPKQEAMKFMYAEMSFFELWWRGIDDTTRQTVKDLAAAGRFELVTGGWVMTDEANAHYHSVVVELMEGHEWIKNHLGSNSLPRAHWSIDPFGMSPTVPFLMNAANVTRAAIQRIHYSVKKELAKGRNLEFVWRQMWDRGTSTDVRVHMFPFYSYDVPHTCGPEPKVCCQFDFRRLPAGGGSGCPWNVPPQLITEANVATRAALLYDQYRKKAQLYKTNAVLIPLGDDFRYDSAFEWRAQYDNYEKLFAYMNSQKEWNVKARWGTLSDYFSVMERHLEEQKLKLPVLSGDFFTYADRDDHYWSGYFTSRPFYKQLDRVLQHYLRSAEIAFTLARAHASPPSSALEDSFPRLVTARRALSLFQHHDGVTGTAKDAVVEDYGKKMLEALLDCEEVMGIAFASLLQKKGSAAGQLQLDETRSKHDSLPERRVAEVGSTVLVFNALSSVRKGVTCVRVADAKARVQLAGKGERPRQQLNPVVKLDDATGSLGISHEEYELCWEVEVGPFSIAAFSVGGEDSKDDGEKASVAGTAKAESADFSTASLPSPLELRNEHVTAEFDANTGMLQSVTASGSAKIDTKMHFVRYGARGHKPVSNGGGDDLSGAYLFLPDGTATNVEIPDSHFIFVSGPITNRLYVRGPKEFKLVTTYTLDAGAPYIEISNEIDVRPKMENVEVAMRIESSIDSGDTIYTDLNGMQMIRRRRQLDKLPLQAHFYPMPASAYIESSSARLNLLGAQALGVASLKSGELEVMLERRLLQDDGRGLVQGVTDNKRTASHFRLLVEPLAGEATEDAARMGYLSQAAFSASNALHYPWVKMLSEDPDLSPSFSGLASPLPCDVHVVTLRTTAGPTDYNAPPVAGSSRPVVASTPSAALVLYRPLVDCRSKAPSPGGCTTTDTSPSSIFGPVLKSASPATLTMLYEATGSVDRFALEPQQIKTFKLNF